MLLRTIPADCGSLCSVEHLFVCACGGVALLPSMHRPLLQGTMLLWPATGNIFEAEQ
jgi:hypothetical protein